MSLKAFHIFFIIVSTVFCIGFGVWGIQDFQQSGNWVHLSLGVASFITSVALLGYGVWFMRKLKNVGYL